ncbi:hypothetical protein BGW80DRAFT_1292815 [Lactifluus volemus]|nr:hypothetical protein BGW80DRAFT_1292815 [Lactifluus volemus]
MNTWPPRDVQSHHMMSQPQFQLPLVPSPQLRVVLDYFNRLSRWELDELSLLSSANFIQETLPASMGVPSRTKSEDIAFLKELRDSLHSLPLEVCHRSSCPRSFRWLIGGCLKIHSYALRALLRKKFGN